MTQVPPTALPPAPSVLSPTAVGPFVPPAAPGAVVPPGPAQGAPAEQGDVAAGAAALLWGAAAYSATVGAGVRPVGVTRGVVGDLGTRERVQAEGIVTTWGGVFHAAQHWPGIDGVLDGRPVSLRRYEGRSASGVVRHVSIAEDGARKAGHTGVDVYVEALGVPTDWLLDLADAGIPGGGALRRIWVRTADGWFLLPGRTP